jgi:hypothetical protein
MMEMKLPIRRPFYAEPFPREQIPYDDGDCHHMRTLNQEINHGPIEPKVRQTSRTFRLKS